MGDLKIGTKSVFTQSGGAEPVLASTVTGGAGLSGMTSLGAVTSGSIGSGVTGYTGVKEFDMWRLTTSAQGPFDLSTNIERVDTYEFGKLGTGMSESSGIFTFPSTGYWKVDFHMNIKKHGDSRYNDSLIYVTPNNGSNWYIAAYASCFVQTTASSTTYSSSYAHHFLDVTDLSNIKVKFRAGLGDSSAYCEGSSTSSITSMSFMRIGDT